MPADQHGPTPLPASGYGIHEGAPDVDSQARHSASLAYGYEVTISRRSTYDFLSVSYDWHVHVRRLSDGEEVVRTFEWRWRARRFANSVARLGKAFERRELVHGPKTRRSSPMPSESPTPPSARSAGFAPAEDASQPRVSTVRSERDRYRAALEFIRDHGNTHEHPCWALHQVDCAEVMQEAVRAALGEEPSNG